VSPRCNSDTKQVSNQTNPDAGFLQTPVRIDALSIRPKGKSNGFALFEVAMIKSIGKLDKGRDY